MIGCPQRSGSSDADSDEGDSARIDIVEFAEGLCCSGDIGDRLPREFLDERTRIGVERLV